MRVATLLKQASATAAESATEDQASDHRAQTETAAGARRETFDLNITEDPPTAEQLQTILEYVGLPGIPGIVKGASSTHDALKKFRENNDNFQRPVVVDWNHGKAIAGDKESEILKLLGMSKGH